jgi:predicted metal-dependent HD superfamily phosphohydrolase
VTAAALADLRHQWSADITELAPLAGPELHRQEGELLLRGWSEPHRSYHTLQHLTELFAAVEELAAVGAMDAAGEPVVRIAGWYHDLAYDPQAAAGSNEHRSAALARDHLHRLGVDPATVDEVEALILMTADHQGEAGADPAARHTGAIAVFHDSDLWILAAPRHRFEEYCRQVRTEYAHVPDELYAVARAGILESLVGVGRVYRTAHAREHWEDSALANVAREVERLTG